MPRWFVPVVAAVLVTGLLASMAYFYQTPRVEKAYTPDNLIRFHVIADSDAPGEQAVKRQVRDALMEELAPEMARLASVNAAHRLVVERLPQITAVARRELAAAGRDYGVRAEVGSFPFPTRSYAALTLPAGNYEAVRVVLGEGGGENWWCVLFPPLCFVDISNSVAEPVVPALASPPAGEPEELQLRWRFLEVWQASRSYLARLGMSGT